MDSPTKHKSAMNNTMSSKYRPMSHSKRLRACECHLWMMIACNMSTAPKLVADVPDKSQKLGNFEGSTSLQLHKEQC